MRSPFPGMDPYLEPHWRDVHQSLCTYARDALQPQIKPALRARLEERLIVESPWDPDRSIYPDVKIIEREPWQSAGGDGGGGTAVMETTQPFVLRIMSEPTTEPYVTIIDPADGGKIVTVIEFLSPTNKTPGQGVQEYRRKQQELQDAEVSLVEIDLLRSGERVVLAPQERIPDALRTTYQVSVLRVWWWQFEVYSATLREPLPVIRIPLRKGDRDAVLNLQALIELTYQNGAYDDIDYAKPPQPPLDPADAAWAEELLKAAGKRA